MASTAPSPETSLAPRAGRGRPRSVDKNRAILEAAGELFLTAGFERTSMDAVAREAGVSKQTVYAHFRNKERLFRAVIAEKVADYFPEDPLNYGAAHSVRDTLSMIGRQYVRLIISPDAIAMFRLLAANVEHHPKMVALYFEEGPARLNAAIRAYLERAREEGALRFANADAATARFCTLLRGDTFFRATLGLLDGLDDEAIDAHVADCVEAFLVLYRYGA